MPAPVSRYEAPRNYVWTGLAALAFTSFSAWVALAWPWAWVATALLFLSSGVAFALGVLPDVEIHEGHLRVNNHRIPWNQIARLDALAAFPLVVRITFMNKRGMVLVYAGDGDARRSLLRNIRRYSREALIDGAPWRTFWNEQAPSTAGPRKIQNPPQRYPLLLANDEADVERMFQQLKSVGHLDPQNQNAPEDK